MTVAIVVYKGLIPVVGRILTITSYAKVIVKILRKNILGLCYPGYKTIILSPRIIFLPQRYWDTIILHEMAHLKFPHHRKAFWSFLTILLGEDFKLQKDRMDTMMGIFYNYSEFLLK